MTGRRLVAALGLVLLVGCGRGGGAECAERMDALGARLVALAERPIAGILIPAEIEPLESSAGRLVYTGGPVAIVAEDGALSLDGRPVADVAELAVRVQGERARLDGDLAAGRLPAAFEAPPLFVWLDRRGPASVLHELRAALPPAIAVEVLAVEADWTPPERDPIYTAPRAASLRELLDARDPSDRAAFIAKRVEAMIGKCEPLEELFGEVAMAENKGLHIARELPARATQCRCRIEDLDLFEYVMLALLGAYDRPVRAVPWSEWERAR